MLRDSGHEMLFLEGFFYSNSQMRQRVRDFGADALGVYVISLLWDKARPFITDVKVDIPSIFTFIGGHGATAMPERLMEECSALDAIIIGEGELTSREMVDTLAADGDLSQVAGLLVRDGNGILRTPARPMIDDMDMLPFPAVDLCEMDRYYPSFEQVSTVPAVQMLASRGCTGSCLYYYKMYGKRIRLRDPVRIVDEMEYYVEELGAKEIKFWDEHFTHDHEHVYRLCEEIVSRGLKVRWWVSARADSVDKLLLRAMKKAGCWCINFGVESGVQKNLDTLLKFETLDRIRYAVRLAHSVGLKTHTTYIFGIPGETFEEGLRTIEFAKELGSFTVEFFPITPFPGTPLYKGVESGSFGRMSDSLSDQWMRAMTELTRGEWLFPCHAGSKITVIDETGKVKLCELRPEVLGDLREERYDLHRVLTSERTREIRDRMNEDKCTCTWECATILNILFSPEQFPGLLRNTIREWGRTKERRI